jgi:NAD(P)-dependent dehydrogenase (short-subunit alcohol dehydrogenase family)
MSETPESKRVFIGGIAGGMGSRIADLLSSRGWTVGGFSRPSEGWSAYRDAHPDFHLHDADATDSGAVEEALGSFVKETGGLEAYIHAVGAVSLKPLHMIKDAEWRTFLAQNLDSAFYAARAAIGPMRKQKSGSLVFFSSVAAEAGIANHELVGAAKGGVAGLARSIAATYASAGIRANVIAPGLVETPATKMLTSSEQARRISEKMHPLGRIGDPGELASLAAWLVSEDASWMTAQVLSLDGGMGSIVPKPRV